MTTSSLWESDVDAVFAQIAANGGERGERGRTGEGVFYPGGWGLVDPEPDRIFYPGGWDVIARNPGMLVAGRVGAPLDGILIGGSDTIWAPPRRRCLGESTWYVATHVRLIGFEMMYADFPQGRGQIGPIVRDCGESFDQPRGDLTGRVIHGQRSVVILAGIQTADLQVDARQVSLVEVDLGIRVGQ